jgi:hypothetical protein
VSSLKEEQIVSRRSLLAWMVVMVALMAVVPLSAQEVPPLSSS